MVVSVSPRHGESGGGENDGVKIQFSGCGKAVSGYASPMATKRELGVGAGAAMVTGAAAVAGGKLAWDKLSGDGEEPFQLYAGEPIPDGIRRIARGQLDQSRGELEGAPRRRLADSVHDTRKSLKRLRTCVRLSRQALGEDVYKHENTAFRDTGRRLAGARDAKVLLDTLDELNERARDELPGGATSDLHERLERERDEAEAALRDDETAISTVVAELNGARARTAAWTFSSDGFEALEPGLARIYRRGRKAMRQAREEPSDEHFHDWRKRVKDLWHSLQILRPAAPGRMKRLAKRTHKLSDLLGDDHDLAELRRYAETHPECFANPDALAALSAVIDRRRAVLQRRALGLGAKLYSASPKRFVAKIARAWDKRAAPAAA
jgi:CHAD domain-containing protein